MLEGPNWEHPARWGYGPGNLHSWSSLLMWVLLARELQLEDHGSHLSR